MTDRAFDRIDLLTAIAVWLLTCALFVLVISVNQRWESLYPLILMACIALTLPIFAFSIFLGKMIVKTRNISMSATYLIVTLAAFLFYLLEIVIISSFGAGTFHEDRQKLLARLLFTYLLIGLSVTAHFAVYRIRSRIIRRRSN